MKIARLYIDNFMCYDKSLIDFTEFSAALIVGTQENNDMFANGVGKTTIFKAIEYVLFNMADIPLERIIRDDTDSCQVILDFSIGDQEYRLSRSRTKKGSTDLTLYERTGNDGPPEEKWYVNGKMVTEEKYWKDISGRRTSDTEKELAKLIKINYKSFRVFVHFMQHDFTGLTTATPEKRKVILKDALNLIIYSKLEKLSKDKSSSLAREIDNHKSILNTLGNPEQEIITLTQQLAEVDDKLDVSQKSLDELNSALLVTSQRIDELVTSHANVENKFAGLAQQEKALISERNRLEISVKEYQSKKSNIIKAANELVAELKALEAKQKELAEIDYSQIDILNEQINERKVLIAQHNINIQSNMSRYEELKIPMPVDSVCKHCRQPLTSEHKKICQEQIQQEMSDCQLSIQNSKSQISNLNKEISSQMQIVNSLSLSKQRIENVNTKIVTKTQEIQEKKTIHTEYTDILNKFINELASKNTEIDLIKLELLKSPIEEAKALQKQIDVEKQNINSINAKISILNKEITHYTSNKAVLQHSINQKNNDKNKKQDLTKLLAELENKFRMYPLVIQAFSSTGIPNLIIQNVLDDLQIEANNLLGQLKPGIQLSFFVEKTKGDGTDADTLDIKYQRNGKDRYYEQLSGAEQMSVTFALKLGLSFLLQKTMGVDIRFLLLDEIDQPLDKASVDAYADIVKFFQKDFTIMVITHNDRLKDKFSHAILVEQDINMISRAKVVSSW